MHNNFQWRFMSIKLTETIKLGLFTGIRYNTLKRLPWSSLPISISPKATVNLCVIAQ